MKPSSRHVCVHTLATRFALEIRGRRRGFALVVTLSLMILLTLVAVGLLTLSSISLRSASSGSASAIARANARMAMMIAIGELQKQNGRDQSVTARADLPDEESQNPAWTGAWQTDAANSTPVWLVSGTAPNPATALTDASSVALHKPLAASAGKKALRAPLVPIKKSAVDGGFAWWVGDEGTKARVDLKSATNTESASDRMTKSQSPQAPGLENLGDPFPDTLFGRTGAVDKSLLISAETIGLAAENKDVPKEYFDDITSGGYGLPVNVKLGGMKNDLSLVFDRSQQNKPFVSAFLGATPSGITLANANTFDFNVSDKLKFFLSDELVGNVPQGVGPNWGTLFNYARLWSSATSGTSPMVASNPRVDSDLRQQNWLPYMRANAGTVYHQDIQQTNSAVAPVISVVQFGLMMGAKAGPPKPNTNTKRYQPQLLIKPVIGLWNPYNVAIAPTSYQLDWAIAPYFRLDFDKPGANGTFPGNSGNVTEMWLRDYWKIGDSGLPTPSDPGGGRWMRLRTEAVDFQPGEFRLFSVAANPAISSDFNLLVPTLDPKGAFTLDIIRSDNKPGSTLPEDKKGQPLLIDEGSWGWFGDVYLQDTHVDGANKSYGVGTVQHFKDQGKQIDLDAAVTWLSLKARAATEDINLNRYTNLWNGGRDEKSKKPYLPEPLITARNRLTTSGASGKMPHRIESLASGNPGAVGTWRFYTRNSLEIDDPGQGARGWIDSNPVTLSSNMKLDGSRSVTASRDGWNATAHLIPGAHRTGAIAGDVGDGFGGNRGLVAEGGYSSNAIPQGVPSPGRWQGFGGPGSTAATGYTHVIAYDVPRTPLVSVGQFQHAQLSRYNFEPGFVVGNSYANPRIPPNVVAKADFAGITGFKIVDTSYQVNSRIWDSVFFSTLGLDYLGKNSGSFDSAFGYNDLVLGKKTLPNPRMAFNRLSGDNSIDKIIADAGVDAPKAIAARIGVNGAFNVNSTSVAAWKAFLSSMASSELPSIDPKNGSVSWQNPEGVRFNRFGHTISSTPSDGSSREADFWQGWRELSSKDLDALAKEIVVQIRERGPFRSFADFVNRNPSSSNPDHQRKGALQAALDKTLNNKLPGDIGRTAENPTGAHFSPNVAGENQTAGHAAYLLQGDLLQSLSPVMQARSDYFRIRTYGEAKDQNGTVIAKAWCEAFVQRSSSYVDPSEKPETAVLDLKSTANKNFGRQIHIVSFRWLAPSEI